MCYGCKQTLCFNEDRSEVIKELLKNESEKILRIAPSLEQYKRKRDAPAHWRQCGLLRDKEIYTSMSCFHYCHSNYFVLPTISEEEYEEEENDSDDDMDDQLSSII
jgi:hypothetical protein